MRRVLALILLILLFTPGCVNEKSKSAEKAKSVTSTTPTSTTSADINRGLNGTSDFNVTKDLDEIEELIKELEELDNALNEV